MGRAALVAITVDAGGRDARHRGEAMMDLGNVFSFAIPAAVIAVFAYVIVKAIRGGRRMRETNEALFVSMFPDLQPHFHPAKLAEYVLARRARQPPQDGFTWKSPPGFPAAAAADVRLVDGRERVRLLDPSSAPLSEFVFEEHPEGGVLRLGKGKFTVNIQNKDLPRVRYWHPDREFKWTSPHQWKFVTRIAEEPIDSSDRGMSWSDSSSSSSSNVARGAAAATGIAAAGGAFDGGGASHAWDDGGRAEASAAGASGSAAATTY